MPNTCISTDKNGSSCQAYPTFDSLHCFNHDPNFKEAKLEAVRNGGRQRKKLKSKDSILAVESIEDVIPCINQCIKELRSGEILPKTANAIGYLLNIAMDAMKVSEIEKRITEVENVIHSREENE